MVGINHKHNKTGEGGMAGTNSYNRAQTTFYMKKPIVIQMANWTTKIMGNLNTYLIL